MAGDIFQPTFGDRGWNQDFVNMNDATLTVDRDPALDYVAGKAKEKAQEEEMDEGQKS